MAFIANYTVTLSADGASITIVDTSDYTVEQTSSFFARRIYLAKADGSFIQPSTSSIYWDFAFGTNTITIPLDNDYALNIILELVPNSPVTGSVYQKQGVYGFINRLRLFAYSLTQSLASLPNNLRDGDFISNKYELHSNIKDCELAITFNDLTNAQAAIYRAQKLSNNAKLYF